MYVHVSHSKVVADVCEQLVGVAKRKEGVVSPVQPNGRTRGDWELTNEETSRLTAIQVCCLMI